MSFSVILPTLNENDHIIKLIKEISSIFKLQKKEFEIIIVDDNSSDGTYETVKNFQIDKAYLKVILRKNKKKNLAESINDGIEASKFDNIIWLDADFQHPPKYINDFIEKSKNYEVIISSRFLKESDRYFNDPHLKKEINENQSYFFNKLCRNFLFADITDYTSGFICVKKKFFRNYKLSGYYGDYFVNMIVKFKEKKITILEIPFKDDLRASGKSKTVINVNIKYIYTCLRYFITLLKSFVQSKFNKYK
jgi:dolichol-phosphate mannosyltransferase